MEKQKNLSRYVEQRKRERARIVADVDVQDEGTLVLFTPRTEAAQNWIENSVQDGAQFWAGALVVEHRYAQSLLDGMVSDGLTVREA